MSDRYPLIAHTVTARARASFANDPALVDQTAEAVAEAKALSAIHRAGLTPEAAERVAVALLTDKVDTWLHRTLAQAPRNLSPATRAKIVRLLTAEGREGK